MNEQLSMFDDKPDNTLVNKKRRWENAFQKWSDEQSQDGTNAFGICGCGQCCDYCTCNYVGRPCVRALNAMCRDKGITIDYDNYNFEEVW